MSLDNLTCVIATTDSANDALFRLVKILNETSTDARMTRLMMIFIEVEKLVSLAKTSKILT